MNPDHPDSDQQDLPNQRREFLKSSVSALAFSFTLKKDLLSSVLLPTNRMINELPIAQKSIIGGYGGWAASLLKPVPPLSFRSPKWKDVPSWHKEASAKAAEVIASPSRSTTPPKVSVDKKYVYDGLEIEEISWQLPYGRRTKAVVLKPQGVTKPLPAILGLHDHGGKKYFGYRKIVKLSDEQHPLLKEHQASDYGGKAWANEVAKRGFLVMVHDTFTFGSRRVFYEDCQDLEDSVLDVSKRSDADPEKRENIEAYNLWAGEHEHVMSKSLFCAGTTWPGVFLSEDQTAVDILSARKDVIPDKIGCGGLSGGGLRTVYLGGMDKRIKCAVCVGFMSTWEDLVLTKSITHTWMTFTPLLPNSIDFPELLGLRVPLPTLVQNNNQDVLYTLSEMKKADQILKEVYDKAGASDKYAGKFYDGPHKFDAEMQVDAFNWFDKWLK
jgi:dienelactone hydrolase